MAATTTLRGELLSVVSNRYDAFEAPDGRTVPAGVTYTAWLHTGSQEAPTPVKVTEDVARGLTESLATGNGRLLVQVFASVFARRNRIEYRADAVDIQDLDA